MLDRLKSIFENLNYQQASYKVYALETQYPDSRRIYIPHKPYSKLLDGMESSFQQKIGLGLNQDDNLERSLRRTKGAVRDLTLCNQFELFVTFTFRSDRQNIKKCKTKMANWIKNQIKRKGKFEYLIIPEFHKDKESLHFHALIKGYTGKVEQATNPKTGKLVKQNGRQSYTLPGYTLGFNNVRRIDQTPESHRKVGSYIRKYITKDMPILFGKNRYWASRGLKRPVIIENPPKWYEGKKPDWSHESERGLTLIFNTEVSDVK